MLNILKKIYCSYITQLFLRSKNEEDLNTKLDKIIDRKMENAISGDRDLLSAINYTISYRKYTRHISDNIPIIDNFTMIKIVYKSLL